MHQEKQNGKVWNIGSVWPLLSLHWPHLLNFLMRQYRFKGDFWGRDTVTYRARAPGAVVWEEGD